MKIHCLTDTKVIVNYINLDTFLYPLLAYIKDIVSINLEFDNGIIHETKPMMNFSI